MLGRPSPVLSRLVLPFSSDFARAQDVLDRQATEERLQFLRDEIDRERHLISEAAVTLILPFRVTSPFPPSWVRVG